MKAMSKMAVWRSVSGACSATGESRSAFVIAD